MSRTVQQHFTKEEFAILKEIRQRYAEAFEAGLKVLKGDSRS